MIQHLTYVFFFVRFPQFVDMKMKVPPQTVLDSFREFMDEHDNNPTKDDIRQFVNVSKMGFPLLVLRFSHQIDHLQSPTTQKKKNRNILSNQELSLSTGFQKIGKKAQVSWKQLKTPTTDNGRPI